MILFNLSGTWLLFLESSKTAILWEDFSKAKDYSEASPIYGLF